MNISQLIKYGQNVLEYYVFFASFYFIFVILVKKQKENELIKKKLETQ